MNKLLIVLVLLVSCAPIPKKYYTNKPECVDFVSFKQYQSSVCSPDEPLRREGWYQDGEYKRWYQPTECVKLYDKRCSIERSMVDSRRSSFMLPYALKTYEIKMDR